MLSLCAAISPQLGAAPEQQPGADRSFTLEECIAATLANNHLRPASRFAVAIAEAQHQQALAGYWPQLALRGAYQRIDEAPNFIFPSAVYSIAPQTIHLPAGTALVTVPAGVLGPTEIQLPVTTPAQAIPVPGQSYTVPEQDVRLMDPHSVLAGVEARWLLYDGGMRRGYREQAGGLVDMMKADARRTDLELIDTVKRYYHGAVLAAQLRQLGTDTLARMEATLSLTETMYQQGGGTVQKTDFLDNKVIVETLRAIVAQLEKNEAMARAALANTMGLPWNASITPADRTLAFAPLTLELEALVQQAYEFSPDWEKIEAGLRSLEGAVVTARSGHAPKLALTGELHRWWNDDRAGIATHINKRGWSVALGIELPLFDGFLTRHQVAEARARVAKLKEEQLLLKDGLGLRIKDVFLGLDAAQKSHQATSAAMTAAQENRDLNTRAYQSALVDTEKVIRAQLMEALMSAQHYKTSYDVLVLQSQLNLLVGTEVLERLRR
ncbi:TolC family protein [Opitutus terrae]|uniref:TolC family protein n=1 Tax=Opitutus terrae TaxID=107709 RepID=UPI0002E982EC|nr:TolC family protein [Opitutus terrae]